MTLIIGILFLISGVIYLKSWDSHRKYAAQKKLGFGFLIMGALLVLAYLLGWLR